MEKINICLMESINGVPFGASRDSARAAFGHDFEEFRKSKFSKNTTDDYDTCHVFYSEDNVLKAIEVFDISIITVDGITIPESYPDLVKWLKSLDPSAQENDDGMLSIELSIGIYAPNGYIEGILFGGRNYYGA